MGGRSRSNSNTSMMSSSQYTINTNYTSKSSVFTTTQSLLLQGTSTSSSYNLSTTLSTSEDVLSNFNQLITDLQSTNNSRDQRSIRIGACCTALIETAHERRTTNSSNNSNEKGGEKKEVVTPNELFIVTISSIQSIQSSLESLSSHSSNPSTSTPSNSNNITTTIENTIIPLLEILNLILPYIGHFTNNNGALLIHQYSNISRMLRLFVVFGYSLNTSGGGSGNNKKQKKGNQQLQGGGNNTGSNALLRQLLKVSTTLLLVTPIQLSSSLNNTDSSGGVLSTNYGVSSKDIGKLLQYTILQMTNDVRPKVRKASWGCLMEIIIASSSSGGGGGGGGMLGEKMDGGGDIMESEGVDKSIIIKKRRIQSQRQVIADYIWEYCFAILTNYTSSNSNNKKEDNKDGTSNKIVHILRFLAMSVPYANDIRIRVRFGEVCLLLLGNNNNNNGGSGNKKNKGGILSMDIMKSVLVTLLSCLELTNFEEEGQSMLLGGEKKETSSRGEGEGEGEISKFASRTLAFLLQHRPNSNASYNNDSEEEDVNVSYGQCLLACMGRMLGNNNNKDDDGGDDIPPPSKLLAMKLLPNVMTSMLHLCESHNGEEDGGKVSSSTCGSEFNQFISRMIPIVMSYINNNNSNNNDKLYRIALEILPQCIPILQSSLMIQYRNSWGCILSGGYSSFIGILSHWLLSSRYNQQSADGDSSSELNEKIQQYIQTLVSSLLKLHDDIAKGDSLARTAVEYATSTVIRGMGVELFVSVVDFVNTDDDSEDWKKKKMSSSTIGEGGIRDDRAWLLPLLKQSASGGSGSNREGGGDGITIKTHLSFFQTNILTLARKCDAASADGQLTAVEISTHKSRVVELWSLLPNFCVYPMDIQENFSMVAKIIIKALGDYERYPKLVPIICGGLKSLTAGVMDRASNSSSPMATEDYNVVSNVSTKILPSLFKLVDTLNKSSLSSSQEDDDEGMDIDDDTKKKENSQQNMHLVEAVTDAIGQLAQICPREFLQTLFKKVIQRLLLATTEIAEASSNDKAAKNVANASISSLLGLGQALVASGSLDDTSLSLLYRAVRPLVRSDEHDPKVQKRAYKVLAEICERHKDFVTSPERLGEMIDLMVESLVTCQVSARHMRLKCMTHIVEGFDSTNVDHMAVIPKIMGEVLLCLKDSNSKTREAAYQLLLAMAVSRDDMTDYFSIVLAALGAQTTHMRSAAVMALSRLAFEYARDDDVVQELLPSVLQTVSVLFDDSSREVSKSVIGFVRVSVAAMTSEQLRPLLPEVVGGILKYNKGRDRFRAKIKIILKKLVRVYGYDVIAPLVPEEHTRLITHMRKLSERAARRKAAGVQDGRSVANQDFDDMMESDEDDSDDGRTFMTGVTGFTRMTNMSGKVTKRSAMDRSIKNKSVISGAMSAMTGKSVKGNKGPRIKAELNGEILDMLDASKMARSVRFAGVDMDRRDFSDDEEDDGMDVHFDNQGRIVISDGMPKHGDTHQDGGGNAEHYESDDDENRELKAGGGGKRRRISKLESVKLAKAERIGKKQKAKNDSAGSIGGAYKSKKAGGDVKKKGQRYEPYAYVPLNAKDYTKKNRSNAVKKMGSVVRGKRKRG